MNSKLNGHLLKCINVLQILPQIGRPPLAEMTEQHLDINYVLWKVSDKEREHEEQREENTHRIGTRRLSSLCPPVSVLWQMKKKKKIPPRIPGRKCWQHEFCSP